MQPWARHMLLGLLDSESFSFMIRIIVSEVRFVRRRCCPFLYSRVLTIARAIGHEMGT
jgi:hypothetical protein